MYLFAGSCACDKWSQLRAAAANIATRKIILYLSYISICKKSMHIV